MDIGMGNMTDRGASCLDFDSRRNPGAHPDFLLFHAQARSHCQHRQRVVGISFPFLHASTAY